MSESLLKELVGSTHQILNHSLHEYHPDLAARKVGTVTYIGPGVVRVRGLRGVKADELILFPGSRLGMAFNVSQTETGVVLLDESGDLDAGDEAERTDRVLDVPVGESLLGRVVDGMGRPLDDRGSIKSEKRLPVEQAAPGIMDRWPVTVPLQTGLKVVDALITNFHLPESTLLMLVSAFYNREAIMKAYQSAIDWKYRFFSFGDAMLIE